MGIFKRKQFSAGSAYGQGSFDTAPPAEKLSVVFFGSGPVAAESLALLSQEFEIETVVTKPRSGQHRGAIPVLEFAESRKLPVHTVSNKSQLSELVAGKPFHSKLGVLIDFGIIVSQDAIDYFPLGIVNSHFSLLPEWRGADPITFSILSGQTKTGVSLMAIDSGLDTGKLLVQKSLSIDPNSTTPSLTAQLIALSHDLLSTYLPKYFAGELQLRSQPHPERATYSRKLVKSDGRIDLSKSAQQLEREVRAYQEWPKSTAQLAGKEVIITKAHVGETMGPKELGLKTSRGYLIIDNLKPSGKQEMSAEAFLAGYGHTLA